MPPYEMPPVKVGMDVLWFNFGERTRAQPAKVLGVSQWSVFLAIFSRDHASFLVRDGVRHADDPTKMSAEVREEGTWDYTDEYKEHMEMKESLATLVPYVQELQERIAALEGAKQFQATV